MSFVGFFYQTHCLKLLLQFSSRFVGILGWNNTLNSLYCTVYPKKYAPGVCIAVLCCGYTLTDFSISIRLTSLALWQSNDCLSASKATLMNMDKYFMWIHYERLHNHNKAKHNKTVCIFLRIYCMSYEICTRHDFHLIWIALVVLPFLVHLKTYLPRGCLTCEHCADPFMASCHIAKTMESTSIRRRSDAKVSDRRLIDVDPMVFSILGWKP